MTPNANPSAEQLAVIESTSKRLVVRASAGAGKTKTVVDRYLRLVTEVGISPDAIVAITFTKKSAVELRDRIIRHLRANGQYENAQLAESGPIGTIHSFFERCLRENCVEAGIDPDFKVFDDSEDSTLLNDCILYVIETADRKDEDIQEFLRQGMGRLQYGGSGVPEGTLVNLIYKVIQGFRSSGWTLDQLESRYGSLQQTLQTFHSEFLKTLDESDRVVQAGSSDFVQRLREHLARGSVKHDPSKKHTDEAALRSAKMTTGVVKLSIRAWERFEQELRSRSALDFPGLELEARRMLRHCPNAVQRLQSRYRVLIVDECQDVNPLQRENLSLLNLEYQCMVGDVKQSIYGFRGADPEGFSRLAEASDVADLSRNYRCSEPVLRTVDRVFGTLWPSYLPALPHVPFDLDEAPTEETFEGIELWNMPKLDIALLAGQIQTYIRDRDLWAGEDPHVTVLVHKGDHGHALMNSLQVRGIDAIFRGDVSHFYTRLEIRDVANALRALDNPANNYAMLAMLRSPFVGVSLDTLFDLGALDCVWDHLDHVVLPTDEDRTKLDSLLAWFRPLAGIADRLNAWELVARLLASSPYLFEIAKRERGPQMIANVRKLLLIASKVPEEGPRPFADRIEGIREIRHREGDAAIRNERKAEVEILTMHSAKGLEFDNVVVAGLHHSPWNMGDLELDTRTGMIVVEFDQKDENLFHGWVGGARKRREMEEGLRVLYVGMTRARKRLVLVASPKMSASTPGKQLATTLDWGEGSPILIREFTDSREAEPDR